MSDREEALKEIKANVLRRHDPAQDGDFKYCLETDCGISLDEVKGILAQVPGEADGFDWFWVIEMKPSFKTGKFGLVTGGCDYSGWGCQDWGEVEWHNTALKAAKSAPEKDNVYASPERTVRAQLIAQLKGEAPYALG